MSEMVLTNNYNLPKIKGSYRFDVDLSKSNWFGVGGKADILFRPQDISDLCHFIKEKDPNLKMAIIGVGSNIIIKDGGFDGVVIKLSRKFSEISHENDQITIGAASLCSNATLYCKINSLSNLEFLTGIPGSIGGAIAMNAGCYGSEVADFLISAQAINENGELIELKNADMGFSYRSNKMAKNLIFVSGTFKVTSKESSLIASKINEFNKNREEAQPIRNKTGGSTFKNPQGFKAWQLIDEAGCRGMQIGDAQISQKHCNFMINKGNAKAKDLIALGNKVIDLVKEKTGIELQWEIKIIGRD